MEKLINVDDCGNWGLNGVSWNSLYAGNVITKDMSEKLYMALAKLKDYEATGLSPEEIESLNDFEKSEISKLLQELGKERSKHKWIPCSEGLPEAECGESETVYCTIRNTETGDRRCKKLYFDGSCWCYPTGEVFSGEWRVIAWQPLPEPYEGDIGIVKGEIKV